MPGVEDTLRSALLADSAVTALIGDRCYAGTVPAHDAPAPWIYFRVPMEEPAEDLAGNDSDRHDVEFELFSTTYQQLRALKQAVRTALNYYRGGYVRRCLWESGDYTDVEGGHNWTDRYQVWSSPTDLGAAVVTWGPVVLVWGSA